MNRLLAAGALAAFVAAMIVIALASLGSDGGGSQAVTTAAATATRAAGRTRPTTTVPKPPVRVKLVAVGPYDPPPGDGTENDSQVPNAVDGNPATFWSTEHYTNGFFKPGVGIVLDAGKRQPIHRVLVTTDEAGSRAEIQLAESPTGPYRVVSADRPLSRATTFALKRGASGRYVLVWLTALPPATGEGHISEVRAFAG